MSNSEAEDLADYRVADRHRATARELARVNRSLRMLSNVNQALIHAEDEPELLAKTCRILVAEGGYRMAMVVFAEHDPGKTLRVVAHHGFEDGYAGLVNLSWDEQSERGRGPGGQAVRSGRPCLGRDLLADPNFAPWRADALQRGYRSLVALPLIESGHTLGALGVYAAEPDAFDDTELAILTELAGDLAFGLGALRRRAAQREDERRRAAHLHFVESLDHVNRALHGAGTLDGVLSDALDAILDVLDCDRCFLMHPCDPDAATWRIPIERTRPDHPGAFADAATFAMTEEVAASLRPLLAADRPVTFGPGCDHPLPTGVAERFGIRSYMSMVVRPGVGKPWQLGVHQCRGARGWTADEAHLFEHIGRRLGDTLTTVLLLEDLRDSEARRSAAESVAHLGYFEQDLATGRLTASAETSEIAGFDVTGTNADPGLWAARVAPEDRERVLAALRCALADGPRVDLELRILRADGTERAVHACADVERDPIGAPVRVVGTLRDITDERRVAEERAFHLRLLECMDRINCALQGTADVDVMLGAALDVVLDVMACDRASLVFPCDPTASTWRVPMERTRPEFPGIVALGVDMPMTPEVAEMHRRSLAERRPFAFGRGTDLPLPPDLVALQEKAGIGMAIYPKIGPPWGFAVQQCSAYRAWSAAEVRLFQELGRRIEQGLTSLLAVRELRERETYLRTLVQTIPDLVWVKDPNGVFLSCNARFERLYGAPEGEIVGRTDGEFVAPELAAFFRRHDQAAMAAQEPCVNEEWLEFRADGYRGLFETVKTALRDPDGRLIGVLGVARDITEHRRAQEDLRVAATAFEAQEGIVITDADQVVLRVNTSFSAITGYAADEIVGQTPRVLRSGHNDAAFYRAMWATLGRDGYWQGEIWNRRKSGDIYPQWLTITAVPGPRGDVTHYVGTLVDTSSRKAAEKEIEHLAFFDSLTDLPNRRLLLDRLQHARARCLRSGHHGALLFIDLDNFKLLNDTRGHDVGDALLVEVSRRLTGAVRGEDTVARLGGDEFVIILENLSESPNEAASAAKQVAEHVRAALGQPYIVGGRTLHSTPSIGVTLFAARERSVEELLKQGDIAMYQAKGAGRNAVRFFDPEMEAALAARATLESALRVAVREHQLELFFQAQRHGRRGLIGAEALLRWRHPERGVVAPGEFIDLAEQTGLIHAIGRWVLESACAQLTAWATIPHLRQTRIAINVSPSEFRERGFVSQVRQALESHRTPPQLLELELTESLVLDDVDDAIIKMRALKALGVGLAMDDFGTGYSSLSYLTRLPLDQLKIDRSFVRNLPGHGNDALVVQSVISLAHGLGMTVVAEGVETEQQRAFLEQHDCMIWQGYLFGRPEPAADFERRWAP